MPTLINSCIGANGSDDNSMRRMIVFLRAVMPTGPNRIPKMSALVEILTAAGYQNVKTYIQSGNILLDTEKTADHVAKEIHRLILDGIGADLHVIVKSATAVRRALAESPFGNVQDGSCVFFVFSNGTANKKKLTDLQEANWDGQKIWVGRQCIHLWLPWDAQSKRLSNTYLEKHLGILSTMRNRNVVAKLCEIAAQQKK